MLRIAAAVVIAPWASLLAVGLHVAVAGLAAGHETWEMSLNYELFAPYGLLIAYPATVVLGVPTHLLLSHFRVGHVWVHAVVGGSVALFIGVLVFDLLRAEDWRVFIAYSTLLVLPGAAVAGAFGAIAGKPACPNAVELHS